MTAQPAPTPRLKTPLTVDGYHWICDAENRPLAHLEIHPSFGPDSGGVLPAVERAVRDALAAAARPAPATAARVEIEEPGEKKRELHWPDPRINHAEGDPVRVAFMDGWNVCRSLCMTAWLWRCNGSTPEELEAAKREVGVAFGDFSADAPSPMEIPF